MKWINIYISEAPISNTLLHGYIYIYIYYIYINKCIDSPLPFYLSCLPLSFHSLFLALFSPISFFRYLPLFIDPFVSDPLSLSPSLLPTPSSRPYLLSPVPFRTFKEYLSRPVYMLLPPPDQWRVHLLPGDGPRVWHVPATATYRTRPGSISGFHNLHHHCLDSPTATVTGIRTAPGPVIKQPHIRGSSTLT